MAFTYDRVFVVINPEGEVAAVRMKEENALDVLPEKVRHFAREEKQFGDWLYGEGQKKWRIKQMKVKDSEGIVST